MSNEKNVAEKIEEVNKWLNAGIPSISLVFGLLNMVKEMFRRRAAGEADPTFEENATAIYDGGTTMIQKADAWLAANRFASDGTRLDA